MAKNLLAKLDHTEQVHMVQAIARMAIHNDHDMVRFKRLLAHQQQEANAELRAAEGAALHRAQGRAKFIDDLVDLIESAPRIAREMEAKRV